MTVPAKWSVAGSYDNAEAPPPGSAIPDPPWHVVLYVDELRNSWSRPARQEVVTGPVRIADPDARFDFGWEGRCGFATKFEFRSDA